MDMRIGLRGTLALGTALSLCGCGGSTYKSPGLKKGERSVELRLDAEMYTVKNGLRVLLLPDENTNLVRVDMRYQVGMAADPPDRTGLAHLAEHVSYALLPQGRGKPDLMALTSLVALDFNAHTSQDTTHYYSTGLASSLESLVAIEAVRMRASCELVDDEMFERERAVVQNELRRRSSRARSTAPSTRTRAARSRRRRPAWRPSPARTCARSSTSTITRARPSW